MGGEEGNEPDVSVALEPGAHRCKQVAGEEPASFYFFILMSSFWTNFLLLPPPLPFPHLSLPTLSMCADSEAFGFPEIRLNLTVGMPGFQFPLFFKSVGPRGLCGC